MIENLQIHEKVQRSEKWQNSCEGKFGRIVSGAKVADIKKGI